MAHIILRPSWHLPENAATPESSYINRRSFLAAAGIGAATLAGLPLDFAGAQSPVAALDFVPSPEFADAGRPLTDENLALSYNNFYEFGFNKTDPMAKAKGFTLDPYTLEIGGLVEMPIKLDLDQIEKLGLEERVYRHRCVEAWSMTVPWVGVPLSKILERVAPKPEAKYVRFVSFHDPDRAPGQKYPGYDWPYHEGLRIDEAMNDLALVTTGLYGKRLAPQSGTPLRIVVPWKYGYKGPKSVVKIELVATKPPTFWNKANADEYKFFSNVDPEVPHPRWSQAKERWLGESLKSHETLWYNGYGEQVAAMYADKPRDLH